METSANKEDGPRLDVAAEWILGSEQRERERAFFDIRVINPYATTITDNLSSPLTYNIHERERERRSDSMINM